MQKKHIINNRYQLIKSIGQGGMSQVYLAHDQQNHTDVAIKFITPQLANNEQFMKRFHREAQIAFQLRHPNIMRVFDVGKNFVVMELIKGGTLSKKLEVYFNKYHTPLPIYEAIRIITPIASALDYAHSHHIVHRDVKPDNIMFDEHGTVKLVDFGIAHLKNATTALTSTNMQIGTYHYMPPEQWHGKEELTGATDQYALAIMTYLMLTMRFPFDGSEAQNLMFQHLMESPPQITSFNTELPAAVEDIIQKALSKKTAQRYASVSGFTNALSDSIQVKSAAKPQKKWGITLTFAATLLIIGIFLLIILAGSRRTNNSGAAEETLVALEATQNMRATIDAFTPTPTVTATPTETPSATHTPTPLPTATLRPTAQINEVGQQFAQGGTILGIVSESEAITHNQPIYLSVDGGEAIDEPANVYLQPNSGFTLSLVSNPRQILEARLAPMSSLFMDTGQYAIGGVTLELVQNRNIQFIVQSTCFSAQYLDEESVAFSCYSGGCQLDLGGTQFDMPASSRAIINIEDEMLIGELTRNTILYEEALAYYELITALTGAEDATCLTSYVDEDGDTVVNDRDMCPAEFGDVAYDGCPDTDGDGVHDGIDECLSERGTLRTNGCQATATPRQSTSTATATRTRVPTSTAVRSSTNTPQPTNTPVPPPTNTPVPPPTNTPVPPPTNTPVPPPTNTPVPPPTNTPVPPPTNTPVPPPTNTPVPPPTAATGGGDG